MRTIRGKPGFNIRDADIFDPLSNDYQACFDFIQGKIAALLRENKIYLSDDLQLLLDEYRYLRSKNDPIETNREHSEKLESISNAFRKELQSEFEREFAPFV